MSSVLKMPFLSLLLSFLFVNSSIAGYVLEDDYSPSAFFDMFSFFTEDDPTHGFVNYVDKSTAQSSGYISTTENTVYIGADNENVTPNGRPSVRLLSNKSYNAGTLVILDLAHMPGGICGTWPAFWMVGPSWPSGGEIDIIEGANQQSTNAMTLHTESGCSITNDGDFLGEISTFNCYVDALDQTANAGCSIDSNDNSTYGSGFNEIEGGVYALEWTDENISIWHFPRGSIPSDVAAGEPDPSSSWGKPAAQFGGGCDFPQFFSENQIVFDLTFCGDWAGDDWSSSTCSSKASTCNDYVENNPSAFKDAYWSINSLQVFTYSANATTPTASSAAPNSTQPMSTGGSVRSSSASAFATSSSAVVFASSSSAFATSSSAFVSASSSSASAYASSSANSTTESTRSLGLPVSITASGHLPFYSLFGTPAAKEAVATTSSRPSEQANSSSVSSTAASSTLSTQGTYSSSFGTGAPMSTIATSTITPTAASSTVSNSQAEIVESVKALASAWSTNDPSHWKDDIDALEKAMESVISQQAAASAKLHQNQRRHLLNHKRRFGGHQ